MEHKRTLPAKQIVSEIRSGATDDQLMTKYNLTTKRLQILFDKLLEAGLVTQAELEQRSARFAGVFDLDLKDGGPVNEDISLSESSSYTQPVEDFVVNPQGHTAPYIGVQGNESRLTSDKLFSENIITNLVLIVLPPLALYRLWNSPQIRQRIKSDPIRIAADIGQIVSHKFIILRGLVIDASFLDGTTRLGKIAKVAIGCVGLVLLIAFLNMNGKQGTSLTPEGLEKIPQSEAKKPKTSQESKRSIPPSASEKPRSSQQISQDVKSSKGSVTVTQKAPEVGKTDPGLDDYMKKALTLKKTTDIDEKTLRKLYESVKRLGLSSKDVSSTVDIFTNALVSLKGQPKMTKEDVESFSQSLSEIIIRVGTAHGWGKKQVTEMTTQMYNCWAFWVKEFGGNVILRGLFSNLADPTKKEEGLGVGRLLLSGMDPVAIERALAKPDLGPVLDTVAKRMDALHDEYRRQNKEYLLK